MKGINPAWANLPRRKCDDCGKSYKPKQPLREGTRGFCSDNCRKSYHKHGGAYRKLRGEMRKMVEKELIDIRQEVQNEIEQIRSLLNSIAKHVDAPYRVELAQPVNAVSTRSVSVSPLPNPRRQA
jgi:hypothetical protein